MQFTFMCVLIMSYYIATKKESKNRGAAKIEEKTTKKV